MAVIYYAAKISHRRLIRIFPKKVDLACEDKAEVFQQRVNKLCLPWGCLPAVNILWLLAY